MKPYQKKIKEYKHVIQKQYVRKEAVNQTVDLCRETMAEQEDGRISYFEFIREQSRYIEKKWWMLQGSVLLLLWYLLWDNGADGNLERLTGSFAAVFAVLIIPEIWKNRRYSSVEIEKAAYYSLRQICAARILMFAMVDLVLITVFFVIALHTVQIMAYRLAVDFLLPFLVSCCICFRFLCSRRGGMEYAATALCMVWSAVWSVVAANEAIYDRLAEPVWLGMILLFLGYLVFCIRKAISDCEIAWEV